MKIRQRQRGLFTYFLTETKAQKKDSNDNDDNDDFSPPHQQKHRRRTATTTTMADLFEDSFDPTFLDTNVTKEENDDFDFLWGPTLHQDDKHWQSQE